MTNDQHSGVSANKLLSYSFSEPYTMTCDVCVRGIVIRGIYVYGPPDGSFYVSLPYGQTFEPEVEEAAMNFATAVYWGVEDLIEA